MINPLSDAAFSDLSAPSAASEEDKRLRVRFFTDEIPDPKRTEEMGRQMFRTVEMCSIKIPGDRTTERVDRVEKMNPDPRKRFPGLYAQFKAGKAIQVEGTLLREWGVITPADAKSYEAIGVYTVEQLAGLSDAGVQQYRGSGKDRQRAQDWLAKAQGLEPVAQARKENADLRAQIDALREQVEALGGKASAPPPPSATSEPPKRRGRPPKAKPETNGA